MKEAHKLKGLQGQLQSAKGQAESLKIEVANLQRAYGQKLEVVKGLTSEIAKLNKAPVLRVSEHAMLRYFERVLDCNLAGIESHILTLELRKMVDTLGGSGTFPVEDFSVVVRDYTVVSVLTK